MNTHARGACTTRPRTLATRTGGKRRRIAAEFLNAVAVRIQTLDDVSEGALPRASSERSANSESRVGTKSRSGSEWQGSASGPHSGPDDAPDHIGQRLDTHGHGALNQRSVIRRRSPSFTAGTRW